MPTLSARFWLFALVALSVLAGTGEAYLYANGLDQPSLLGGLWGALFIVTLSLWIVADSQGRPEVYRPYELGLFAILFWPAYVPYYLIRTRRWAAPLWIAAFFLLLRLGALLSWFLYIVS